MKTSKKLLIAYLIMQFLSVGCAHNPNREPVSMEQLQRMRFAAESFQRAQDSLKYFEPAQPAPQRQPTSCRPDFRGGFICF